MSIQINSSMTVKKAVAVVQVIPQYREMQGHGRRKLLTPDEVLRLPHDELLVIIRGQNILKLNKFDYTRHPMSKELLKVSIMDYSPRDTYVPMFQTETVTEPTQKPKGKSSGRKLNRSERPPKGF